LTAPSQLEPNSFAEDREVEASADDARRRSRASGTLESVEQEFRDLYAFFRTVPPPVDCEVIAAEYESVFGELESVFKELLGAISSLDADRAMKVMEKDRAIEARISSTNRLIEQLCTRFKIENEYELRRSSSLPSGALRAFSGTVKSLEELKRALERAGADGEE
jgi:hypothetical protein